MLIFMNIINADFYENKKMLIFMKIISADFSAIILHSTTLCFVHWCNHK